MGQLNEDIFVNGTLTAKAFTSPAGAIDNAAVKGGAGILATKLQHQYEHVAVMSDHATNAAVKRQQIHRVFGVNATLVKFGVVASVAITGNATITVDLKKNGSTILSATITLDNSTAAFTLKEPAGYTSTSLVAGDVLEADITAINAGTGTLPKGVSCYAQVREDAE